MGVEKELVDERIVESEDSSENEDASKMGSANLTSKEKTYSPDLSSEESEINDSIELLSPRKVDEKNEKFDREAYLHKVADFSELEGDPRIIWDIPELRFGAPKREDTASREFPKSSKYDKMSVEERHKTLVDDLRETLKPVPDTLLPFMMGWFRSGDCGVPADEKPDWLDMEKLRRGQKFAQDYLFPVFYTQLITIMGVYSFDDGLKPILLTGNSAKLDLTYQRYLSTLLRFRRWYTGDTWTKGTRAWKDIRVVRSMHDAARRKAQSLTNGEIDDVTIIPDAWCPMRDMMIEDCNEVMEAPVLGQCPYIVGRNNPNRPRGISQTEMSLTQWSQVGLIILYPKHFGIHDATDEDLEAFCHMWRSIGYQLGIEDDLNFCRGTFDQIRQRSRDFMDLWLKPNFREISPEWEHVSRCIVSSMGILIPGVTYEVILLHMMRIFDIHMPRVYASISYKDWITYNVIHSVFYYAARVPGVMYLVNTFANTTLNRAENATPKQLEAIKYKLSNYKGYNDRTNRANSPPVVQ